MDYPLEIEKRFTHHPPQSMAVVRRHEFVRESVQVLAHVIAGSVPEGREKALAFTKLEEALYWINAGIARNQDVIVD